MKQAYSNDCFKVIFISENTPAYKKSYKKREKNRVYNVYGTRWHVWTPVIYYYTPNLRGKLVGELDLPLTVWPSVSSLKQIVNFVTNVESGSTVTHF